MVEVLSINAQEKTVSLNITFGEINSDKLSSIFDFNLENGWLDFPFIIFAGLEVGSAPYETWPQYTIDSEITKEYCGLKRQVLYLNVNEEYRSINAYWDKTTGFLLELNWIQNHDQPINMVAIETNLWGRDLFIGFDWWLWIIIIVIIACIVIVTIHIIRTKRKKTVHCLYCGARIRIGYNFCPKCGRKTEHLTSAEAEKYVLYLHRLEEKHSLGEISEEIYQKLRNEYLEKLRKTKEK
ncbi:MAG: zinc ribbon domain-containing protein [Candidatus Bathyarchaeia archaeon]